MKVSSFCKSSKVGFSLLALLSSTEPLVNALTISTSINSLSSRTFCVPAFPNNAAPPPSSTALFLDGKGMAGGSQHLLGDVIRSLQPRYISRVADAVRGKTKGMKTFNTDQWMIDTPSWEELSKQLYNIQTPSERQFRSNLNDGTGSPSPLASQRLFSADKPIITLYRDSASWCPYCQKVWIALEEQQIPYEIKKVDMTCYGAGKPEEFLKIQPNGNLPCAVVLETGQVYSESDDIIDFIDSMSSQNKLRPIDQTERIQELCDDGRQSLERRLYSLWMWYLTGVRKPLEYKQIYEEHVDEVEQALANTAEDGPFFLGKDISIVDVRFIPFVERQEASLAYFKGFVLRDESRWPNLVKWMEAMEQRESYGSTKSDWYTHSRALPPQLAAGCSEEASGEEMRRLIDASPSSGSSDATPTEFEEWYEPGWEQHPSHDFAVARREAAERIIHNHKNLVSFASRGAGIPGLPASSAPLADPRSISNESLKYPIDVFLRLIVSSLLSKSGKKGVSAGSFFQGLMVGSNGVEAEGSESFASEEMMRAAQDFVASVSVEGEQGGGGEAAEAVADCLDYVRGRIGVPRDMSYPAAREFRNELLFWATSLRQSSSSSKAVGEEKEIVTTTE